MENNRNHRWLKMPLRIFKKLEVITGTALFLLIVVLITIFNLSDDKDEIKRQLQKTAEKQRVPTIMWYSASMFIESTKSEKVLKCYDDNRTDICLVKRKDVNTIADGYIWYATHIEEFPPRKRSTVFGMIHEESPKNVYGFMREKGLNIFNYSATFSSYSDVPFPLLQLGKIAMITSRRFFVPTSVKNKLLKRKHVAPVLYLQSRCSDTTNRDSYVKELMKYIPVDSYGRCLNNKPVFVSSYHSYYSDPHLEQYLRTLFSPDVLKFISKYKFIISIENAVCQNYITEKFWRSIYVGVVPIYFGAHNIKEWMPNNKSAILVADHPTPELMGRYLNELLANDTKYEEYLEHKTSGLLRNRRIVEELQARPYQSSFMSIVQELECKMCRRLNDRNSDEVHMVKKSHYNCSEPTSVFTLKADRKNPWYQVYQMGEEQVNHYLWEESHFVVPAGAL